MNLFPNKHITRLIKIGGLQKDELIDQLKQHSIALNQYAEQLLVDPHFTVSRTEKRLMAIELAVKDLGLPEGATIKRLFEKAVESGLTLCPLEVAPHFRLLYLDQPEMISTTKNKAPAGSITIASQPLKRDDTFPKGFYVRKIDGVLWLRGYVADEAHIWDGQDRFLFVQ
ncbi:hypothetical protein JOC54_003056 [Alkalihalobacillus xiaoxiensis]|uniref:Helicase n=1 Tax=Shouchella xiaoxiensis TaxID=766895 RepID=A0ABS2SX57_9BACI|nr:helicase [Shouchella xiaoxiensis]MBM7839776.1 hypothetical protein [Shouchella xiaoxiensis]